MIIRKAELQDYEAIWAIVQAVIAGGDTYVFAPDGYTDACIMWRKL